MRCPYCDKEVSKKSDKCPHCGGNTKIYKKMRYTSACLYNKALEQAELSDFSGAVENLKRSIMFDKGNIAAINLLGLVYFAGGHIAQACAQWIISINFKPSDNPANYYLEDFKKDARNFEKLDSAVQTYNEAIKYLQQGNDDLAIIRLKKAIDVSPNLIEAYNLLTLAYIKADNRQEALKTAEKAITKDVNNPITLKYLKELSGSVKRKKVVAPKGDVETIEKIEPGKRYDYVKPTTINIKKNSLGLEIASFGAGLVCACLLMYFLLMPAAVENEKAALEEANSKYVRMQNEYNDLQADMDSKIETLESEKKELQVKADGYDALKQLADKAEVVKKAQSQYDAESYKEAANLLSSLDLTGVTDESVLAQYNSLKTEAYKAAAAEFHKEGEAAYKNGNYTEAQNSFTSCFQYAVTDDEKYTAEYRLGCIARKQGDLETAKKYFTDVKANHPYAKYRGWADTELRSL